jgi:adenine-specific DNA-methyltransferase
MMAYRMLEALTSSISRQIEELIQADDKLTEWSMFHGWNGAADSAVVARQAALGLVLRAMICRRLSPGTSLDATPPNLILERSNELFHGIGLAAPPPSYLDNLAAQATTRIDMAAIDHLAEALVPEIPHTGHEEDLPASEQKDLIGEFYAASIPQGVRRPLGQFWTPLPIAELMTRWAIQSSSDQVMDPAFGSGVFLLTAIRRLRQLGVSPDANFAQVAGVELTPLGWLMGLTNVLLRYPTARPRLRLGDFLMPEREPLAVLKEPIAPDYDGQYPASTRQQLTLPGMEVQVPLAFPERFDAILCNPPYTRHHHLPESYKSTWAALMKQEYGLRLSRFSSLFAYFLVQATRMLAPDGRMAFITPAVVFEASYGQQVKEFIRQQLCLRAIITFDESLSVFEGVDTAACITLMESPDLERPTANQVAHIQIDKWPGAETILRTIEQDDVVSDEWGTSQKIALADLGPQRKWTVVGRRNHRVDHDAFVPLSNLARVVRGIATGANKFFVLSDDEIQKWGLSEAYLRPVLTKTREAPGYIFNQEDFDRLRREGKKRWLLYLNGPVTPDTPEAHYIRYGETLELHQRSLVKTRSLWYAMEQRDPAPIYFTYLSRKKSRFIYNQADVLALNVFLCIYPKVPINQDETTLKALLAMLNSLIAKDSLRHVGRTYGGDTIKIEPREMDQLPVLNPALLSPHDREKLAELFDLLCQADPGDTEKSLRQAIDEVIATIG